ncbi:MAG: hypothetical protein QM765_36995 [Myxococcales bacterium]
MKPPISAARLTAAVCSAFQLAGMVSTTCSTGRPRRLRAVSARCRKTCAATWMAE